MTTSDQLPYTDTKPQGAPDFYFCINATFKFIRERLGEEGLRRYWDALGTNYYKPVSTAWKVGGFPAVARYWKAFFDAEPGSDVSVEESPAGVKVQIRNCPAIAHLRASGRAIEPMFCQHCYFVSEAMARPAGLTVRVAGGNGACTQEFTDSQSDTSPQSLRDISTCS